MTAFFNLLPLIGFSDVLPAVGKLVVGFIGWAHAAAAKLGHILAS